MPSSTVCLKSSSLMVIPATRSSLHHRVRLDRKAWMSPPFRHCMLMNDRWRAFHAYVLLAMNCRLTTSHCSLALGYCLTSNIITLGSHLFNRFQMILSWWSQCFISCFSASIGLFGSAGTGHSSEPSKYSQRSAVSIASWKRASKMAQFVPSELSCGTSADCRDSLLVISNEGLNGGLELEVIEE